MKSILILLNLTLLMSAGTCTSQNINSKTCYEDRKVTEEMENLMLTCMMIGEDYFLKNENGNKRYLVCNSDDVKLEVDKTYIVNGLIYEMKANERWPGTPFQLTSIKILK